MAAEEVATILFILISLIGSSLGADNNNNNCKVYDKNVPDAAGCSSGKRTLRNASLKTILSTENIQVCTNTYV